jgi:hypothetical protein
LVTKKRRVLPAYGITSLPPPLEQPDTVEEDNNEEDKDKKNKENKKGKEEDKMSLPPVPVSFISY